MDTDDLEICLNLFYIEREGYHCFDDIHKHMNDSGTYTIIETQLIIQKLVKDGNIIEEAQIVKIRDGKTREIKETSESEGYLISYEGILFIEQGGYRHLSERIAEQEEFARRERQLGIDLSENQIRVNRWAVRLGVLNFIFIGFTAYFQATDRTDEELKLLREHLLQTEGKKSNIQTSLEKINQTIYDRRNDTATIRLLRNVP